MTDPTNTAADEDGDDDGVRRFLRAHGAPSHVVYGGLDGLVARWERVAAEAERGYGFTFEDWLNDLDGRRLLHDAMAHAAADEQQLVGARIAAADGRFRAATVATEICQWGTEVAAESGYDRGEHWWYWRAAPDLE
ncbi:MAG: hypothetical protein KDE27_32710 [Planctomycetes bacterium]|nr:hypothetical protein [Planctomycetota bacterium]